LRGLDEVEKKGREEPAGEEKRREERDLSLSLFAL